MFDILPKLSKDYVEAHIQQDQVMSYYSGVPLGTINDCLNRNKLICSPLRSDKNPTAGFYVNHAGKLRFNDFGGYFHGDMYDLVGYRTLLDPDDPYEFMLILRRICYDFKLWYYADAKAPQSRLQLDKIPKLKPKEYVGIEVQDRDWYSHDRGYWGQYGLIEQDIEAGHTVAVYAAWINGRLVYSYNRKDPCYAIFHGELDGKEQWKLYFPMRSTGDRESPRFITNTRRMQNISSVTKAPYGIITKAFKDAKVLNKYGVQAVGLAAESIEPTLAELAYLKKHWGTIYSLLDFDYAGVRMANILRKKYDIKPLFLTTGKFGTFNYGSKDISDFRSDQNHHLTRKLITLVQDCECVFDGDYYDQLSTIITPF